MEKRKAQPRPTAQSLSLEKPRLGGGWDTQLPSLPQPELQLAWWRQDPPHVKSCPGENAWGLCVCGCVHVDECVYISLYNRLY